MGIESKIRALLARQARTTSEAEAEACAAQVQRLVEKHQIDLAQLSPEEQRAGFIKHVWSCKYTDPWRKAIASQVAQTFFCKFLVGFENYKSARGGISQRRNFIFIGRQHNCEAAEMMCDWLFSQVVVMGRQHYGTTRDQRAFERGCGERIARRLFDQRQESHRTTPGLPVLHESELDEVEKFAQETMRIRKGRKTKGSDLSSEAAHRGWAEGGRMTINPTVDN